MVDLRSPRDPASVPRVGLVAPLPPGLGGVVSVAEWLIARSDEIGCRYVTFDIRRPPGSEAGGALTVRAALRQIRLLLRYIRWIPGAPRVVHHMVALTGTGLTRDAAFILIAKAARKRTIAHVHGADLDEIGPATPRARLLRLIGRMSAECVTIAPSLADKLGELGVPAEAIFNPVRTAPNEDDPPAGPSSSMCFVFVGTYGERKGAPELVRAFGQARSEGIEATLLFAGKEERGGEEALLHEILGDLGLEETISFLGVLDPPELQKLYAQASVFCLPSYHEGLPMALLEAMAAGIPTITTAVGGIGDVVEDGVTGLLVAPGDVDSLAAAIVTLARDEALRRQLGDAARARVLALAGDDEIVKLWQGVYARQVPLVP